MDGCEHDPEMFEYDGECMSCSITQLEARVAALRAERTLIAEYIHDDPPFDECAGVDIHERACLYSADKYGERSTPEDYYKAFLDCCRAALIQESE